MASQEFSDRLGRRRSGFTSVCRHQKPRRLEVLLAVFHPESPEAAVRVEGDSLDLAAVDVELIRWVLTHYLQLVFGNCQRPELPSPF